MVPAATTWTLALIIGVTLAGGPVVTPTKRARYGQCERIGVMQLMGSYSG